MLTSRLLALTAIALAFATPLLAAPPKVTKAVPDNGDVNVDPGTKEIRITFDQPMQKGGMSIVGGGDSFPEMRGQPRWVTSRTISMPVRLKPNHNYWLSINSDRFQNFTNRAGEAAIPYPIQFRTGDGGQKSSDKPEPPAGADNRRALGALREAVRDHYSYRDRLGLDWDELFAGAQEGLIAAASPQEFAQLAGTLLARAEDKHIWLRVGEETVPSYVRPSTPNANYSLLPKLIPNLKKHGRAVVTGRWDDGIGYLAIATWDRDKLEGGDVVLEAFDTLRDTKGLVIDVRANGGGDERLAQRLAGCFVSEPRLYAQHVNRDPDSAGGFSSPNPRWLLPDTTQPAYRGHVAVLSGPAVMSSCEGFLKMMKQVPECVIVGASSQGSSGNPKPHDLGNGVTVFLPSWKDMLPDGTETEGVGIAPDIAVKTSPTDFASSDPVLEAALIHLRKATDDGSRALRDRSDRTD